jgi:diguanylate cyclase (GGDEF)-like protein
LQRIWDALDPGDPELPRRWEVVTLVAQLASAEAVAAVSDLEPAEHDLVRGIVAARSERLEEAIQTLDTFVEAMRRAGDEAGLMWGLAELGRTLCIRGLAHEGAIALEEALLIATANGQDLCAGKIRLQLAFVVDGTAQQSESYVARTRAAIDTLRACGDLRGTVLGLINLGGGLQSVGDLAAATACYDEALPVAQERGWTYLVALARGGQGGLAYRRGRADEGRAAYAESRGLLLDIGNRLQAGYHGLVEARVCREAGLTAQAIALLRETLAIATALENAQLRTPALAALGEALRSEGDLEGACDAWDAHAKAVVALHASQMSTARAYARERQLRAAASRELEHEQVLRSTLERQNRELAEALEAQRVLQRTLEGLAQTDPLTGLANRRHFDGSVRPALALAHRHGRPFSLILFDLDRFKSINDAHGHAAGDAVLAAVADLLRARLRHTDLAARWGGEEYCIALFETPLSDAVAVAASLRATLASSPIDTPAGPLRVTASFGVVGLRAADEPLEGLFARADAACYAAKGAGRNAVWVDGPAGPEAAGRETVG